MSFPNNLCRQIIRKRDPPCYYLSSSWFTLNFKPQTVKSLKQNMGRYAEDIFIIWHHGRKQQPLLSKPFVSKNGNNININDIQKSHTYKSIAQSGIPSSFHTLTNTLPLRSMRLTSILSKEQEIVEVWQEISKSNDSNHTIR